MTATVIIMGIGREVFLELVGPDTVLRDLRHFALDAERNLGAWYSSALMVLISICAFLNWQTVKHRTELTSYSWLLISVVFFMMSIDETAGFHETVDVPLREKFELTGLFYNPWVFFGAFFVTAFAAALVPFLLSLPRYIAVLFVISGAIYVGGALGLEPFDAFFEDNYGEGSFLQLVSTTVEEALEMIGLTLFLHSNFLFMADVRTNVLLRR
jgi:surface polysaccharide O-acyltransferase-like enzyme